MTDNYATYGTIESNREASDGDEGNLQIVIDRVRAVTIKLPLTIQGQNLKAVIDTGAEVTVFNNNVYFSIPVDKRSKLQ